MTTDCVWELQKAAYAALIGDATLSGMVTGTYSHVPQDTAFPYVKFETIRSSDWSTKTNAGIQATLVLSVFSKGRGAKESLNIIAEINRVLGSASLSMSGCSMVSISFMDSKIMQQDDGLTWKGSISFQVLIQKS
jgi:hypothetical protein